jgi:hypothetical protein
MLVEQDLGVSGQRDVVMISDMSALVDDRPVPGLAAAVNILRDVCDASRLPFGYRDWGNMRYRINSSI